MKENIYMVANNHGVRLIRAKNRAQALSHAARTSFTIRVATQNDLVDFITGGITVENYSPPEQASLDLSDDGVGDALDTLAAIQDKSLATA